MGADKNRGKAGHPDKTAPLLKNGQRVEIKGICYVIEGRRVGKGQFAEVYRAREVSSNGTPKEVSVDNVVAMKVEREDATLLREFKVLKSLQGNVDGICRVLDTDMCLDRRFMSMQLLGDNLSTLRKSCTDTNFRLSWDSTRYLGLEMLRTLQQVHKVGYIHRDVKPSNFAIGRKDLSDSKVYIIDFGLARKYLEDNGWSHQPARENRRFRGSSAYASVHAHKEKDLSRRDDLWSLLYVLVEFQQGDLPWRHACLDSNKEDILRLKEDCMHHPERLAASKDLGIPSPLIHFSNHLNSLRFEESPNYADLEKFLGPPPSHPPRFEFESRRTGYVDPSPKQNQPTRARHASNESPRNMSPAIADQHAWGSHGGMSPDMPNQRDQWNTPSSSAGPNPSWDPCQQQPPTQTPTGRPHSQGPQSSGRPPTVRAGGKAGGIRVTDPELEVMPRTSNAWRLRPEAQALLGGLLALDPGQAFVVVAALLEAVAETHTPTAPAAHLKPDPTSAAGSKRPNDLSEMGQSATAAWLEDVAAHALGLKEGWGAGTSAQKRQKRQ